MFTSILVDYVSNIYTILYTQLSYVLYLIPSSKLVNEITRNNFLLIFKMRKLRFKKANTRTNVTQQVRTRSRTKNIWFKPWMLGFTHYFLKNSKIPNQNVNYLDILNSSYTMNPDTWILDLDLTLSCWVTIGQFTTKVHVSSAISRQRAQSIKAQLWLELRLTLNEFNQKSV